MPYDECLKLHSSHDRAQFGLVMQVISPLHEVHAVGSCSAKTDCFSAIEHYQTRAKQSR